MAQFSNEKIYNTMGLPMNITRGNPIPVDATEVWYSLEEAQNYAANNPTAYVGQSIKVIDKSAGSVACYIIGADGSLLDQTQTNNLQLYDTVTGFESIEINTAMPQCPLEIALSSEDYDNLSHITVVLNSDEGSQSVLSSVDGTVSGLTSESEFTLSLQSDLEDFDPSLVSISCTYQLDLNKVLQDYVLHVDIEGGDGSDNGAGTVIIDETLSISGAAADAKVVGDALNTKQPKGDYATKSFVEDKIAEVESSIGDIDLSGYALKEDVPTKTSDLINDTGYLTEHQSLDGLATESYVQGQIASIPTPDVSGQIGSHNTAIDSHNDIRLLIDGLTNRLNTLANSDDTALDQMSEIVTYIKNNKTLIDGITTNKINVSDIINNLTTNVDNKPLSAAQGVALKALIDAIAVPTKLSQLTNDSGYITDYTETDPTVPSWAKTPEKPTYTAREVGADAQGTATNAVSEHDSNANSHSDIRGLISGVKDRLDAFDKISEGSGTQPIYFSNGKPVATTYTLGASVPSDAKFTDTTYEIATTSTAGLMSAEDKTKLDGLVETRSTLYPIVETTNTAIEPDKYYVFGTVDSIRVTLQNINDGYMHEHCFEFTTADEFYGMSITPEPKWVDEPSIESNKTYQVSILRGIGVIIGA